ncbi:hypothetical protein [Streptomyces sp. NPDC088923]|uniref:hypothetical protein n=1 Tax=Streptomyces sp. NPDC088923 TaxID=3365913 RepID=UPI003810B05C
MSSQGRASGHGQVNQAGGDQRIDQHTEHHHHYAADQARVFRHPMIQVMILVGVVLVVVVVAVVVKFAGAPTAGGTESRRSALPGDSARSDGTASPTAAAPPASASKAVESPSPRTDTPLWSGRVRLTYINLDSDPPSVLSSNTGASFWIHYDQTGEVREDEMYGLGGGLFTSTPTVARWDAPAKPTRQQCAELITTQGSETLPVTAGKRYCVKSGRGRVAVVTAGAFDQDSGNYTGTMTVWDAPR